MPVYTAGEHASDVCDILIVGVGDMKWWKMVELRLFAWHSHVAEISIQPIKVDYLRGFWLKTLVFFHLLGDIGKISRIEKDLADQEIDGV